MNLKKYFLPKENILGIAVTKDSLRASLINENRIIFQAVLGLLDKTILDDNTIDQNKLETSLKKLINYIRQKNRIPIEKEIQTVITLPTSLVFNKHFVLPNLGKKDFLSAIDLNLKLFSPIKEKVLANWQIIKKSKEENKISVLASFIEEKNIILIEKIFHKLDLLPRAIEFHSSTINRVVKNEIYKGKPSFNWMAIYFNRQGIDVSISIQGNLCLSFFNDWESSNPDDKEVYSLLKRTIIQAKNYFINNFPNEKELENIFLFSEDLKYDKLQNLKTALIKELDSRIETPFGNIVTMLSFGAALRGQTFFLEDKEISLSTSGVLKEFNRYQGKIYTDYWGKIISVIALIMLATFLSSFLIAKKIDSNLKKSLFLIKDSKKTQLATKLREEAEQFNSLLSQAISLNNVTYYINDFLKTVFSLAKKNNIVIKKISMDSPISTIKIIASSQNLEDVSNFKKSLKANQRFNNISLPATAQKQVGNEFFFEIDFKYRFK